MAAEPLVVVVAVVTADPAAALNVPVRGGSRVRVVGGIAGEERNTVTRFREAIFEFPSDLLLCG